MTRHQFTACIGYNPTFFKYLSGYEYAFNILMENVYNSGFHIDLIAYPLLFIARHCMELGFKANIRFFIKYSKKDYLSKGTTHDLEALFLGFKEHFKCTVENLKKEYGIIVAEKDITSFNGYCKEVGKLTYLFHKLDKHSDSFRYPVDKQDNKSFEMQDTINLLDVKELLEKSMVLLFHTTDVFAKYTDIADEMLNIYEQEMRENFFY